MRVSFQTSSQLTEGNIHKAVRIFDSITRAEGMSSTIKILNAHEIVKHIHYLYHLDEAEKILELSPPLPIIQILNEEGRLSYQTPMNAASRSHDYKDIPDTQLRVDGSTKVQATLSTVVQDFIARKEAVDMQKFQLRLDAAVIGKHLETYINRSRTLTGKKQKGVDEKLTKYLAGPNVVVSKYLNTAISMVAWSQLVQACPYLVTTGEGLFEFLVGRSHARKEPKLVEFMLERARGLPIPANVNVCEELLLLAAVGSGI